MDLEIRNNRVSLCFRNGTFLYRMVCRQVRARASGRIVSEGIPGVNRRISSMFFLDISW